MMIPILLFMAGLCVGLLWTERTGLVIKAHLNMVGRQNAASIQIGSLMTPAFIFLFES